MATILVVDDRPANRELFVTLLGYSGHRMLEASEGEAGLAIARAEHPDLIIADIVMPKMDGYEFARQVRSDPTIANTQIIFVTASYIIEHTRPLAEACGVSIVLSKPIEPEIFLAEVNKALAANPTPVVTPTTESFHQEHMRHLTDTLALKVEELEAEIVERKQAETALLASEQKYRSLFKDSPISIWEEDFSLVKQRLEVLYADGIRDFRGYFAAHPQEVREYAALVRITDVNRAALQMYHARNRGEMLENLKHIIDLSPEGNFHNELVSIAEGHTHFHWEGTDHTLTGHPIEISLSWSVAPGYEADYSKVIVSTLDITRRKQAEEVVKQYAADLERRVAERTIELTHANRAKSEFLATMSHELRTPLNSILGLSESLLERHRGPLTEKQEQALQVIAASGNHLLGLINDVLEVSKIEAGKLKIYPDLVSVKEVCESSFSFIRELATKKSITLDFRNHQNVATLFADPQRLKQILINLLNNAVKFTPERGKVSLEVAVNAERAQIQFIVSDNGIGIAPDDLQKLFSPFMQVDSSLARQYPGTGLGLTIVHKLVELHGGSVQVESEVGKGSRFTVNLPWDPTKSTRPMASPAEQPAAVVNESEPASKTPIRVLLADDHETNTLMLREYLQDRGYEVIIAKDGREALAKAADTLPHIILMDIQMPELDGLEAIKQLRADPHFIATPIIALTALTMSGDRERCLAAGANEYMSKPVGLRTLANRIHELINQVT